MADDAMMEELLGNMVGDGTIGSTPSPVSPEMARLEAMLKGTPWLTQGPSEVSLGGAGQIAQVLFGQAMQQQAQEAALRQSEMARTVDLKKAYEIMKLKAETAKALAEGQIKQGEYRILQAMAPDIFGEDPAIGAGAAGTAKKVKLPAGATLKAGPLTLTSPKSIDSLLAHRVMNGDLTIEEAAGILGNVARAKQRPSEKERGLGRLKADVSQMSDEELLEILE